MSEILLYKTANQEVKLEVLIQNETIWLNQKQLCELFGRDKSVISRHIKNIYNDKELDALSTVAKNATVQKDWIEKLDKFLMFNEKEILEDNGSITAVLGKELAEDEYEKYIKMQDEKYISDFDNLILGLEKK